jgi:hypothetical protein
MLARQEYIRVRPLDVNYPAHPKDDNFRVRSVLAPYFESGNFGGRVGNVVQYQINVSGECDGDTRLTHLTRPLYRATIDRYRSVVDDP